MPRERIRHGDLVWVTSRRIAGLGDDLILIRTGSPPTDVVRATGEQKLLCVFLRRQRIDFSLDRATFPIVLHEGCEYTILVGRMRLCK